MIPSTTLLTPMIETLEVERIPSDGQLTGQSVETPRPGTAHDILVLPVAGWIHAAGSATATAVHVVSEGRSVASAAVSFVRPDVASHLGIPEDAPVGFLTDVNLLGLPLGFELGLEVELDDGRRFPFARISGRRQTMQPRFQPTMRPIFVTNIGRCGSTLMMNVLRCHPRIVVHDLYPYETRALSYWVHMLKVLGEPANHARSANPNSYEDDAFWVGRHPHNMRPVIDPPALGGFLRRDYLSQLAEFAQASTEAFYSAVREAQGVDDPVYFAEKRNPRPTARIASELYPDAREIFLVRDPRDMVCSMISFYEKTQLVSFGRDRSGSDAEFIGGIAHAMRDLVRQLRERRDGSLLVRYEDLVGDMPGTLRRVLDYLELPTSAETRDEIVEQAQASTSDSRRHRTTADGGASMGRWRRDLDEPMQELCLAAFGDLIEELGYEL